MQFPKSKTFDQKGESKGRGMRKYRGAPRSGHVYRLGYTFPKSIYSIYASLVQVGRKHLLIINYLKKFQLLINCAFYFHFKCLIPTFYLFPTFLNLILLYLDHLFTFCMGILRLKAFGLKSERIKKNQAKVIQPTELCLIQPSLQVNKAYYILY